MTLSVPKSIYCFRISINFTSQSQTSHPLLDPEAPLPLPGVLTPGISPDHNSVTVKNTDIMRGFLTSLPQGAIVELQDRLLDLAFNI